MCIIRDGSRPYWYPLPVRLELCVAENVAPPVDLAQMVALALVVPSSNCKGLQSATKSENITTSSFVCTTQKFYHMLTGTFKTTKGVQFEAEKETVLKQKIPKIVLCATSLCSLDLHLVILWKALLLMCTPIFHIWYATSDKVLSCQSALLVSTEAQVNNRVAIPAGLASTQGKSVFFKNIPKDHSPPERGY